MTHEQHLDERMIEWLEGGPSGAPVETLEAAVAYARAHPRRRLLPRGRGRTLMTRFNLTEVQPRHQHRITMAAMAAAVVVVAVIAAGIVVVGGLPNNQGPAGPARVLTPSTTPSEAPSPAQSTAAAPPVQVTGSSSCIVERPGDKLPTGDSSTTQLRDEVLRCTLTTSDPRLGGNTVVTLNEDQTTGSQPLGDLWGTMTVTGVDGSMWSGPWSGSTADIGNGMRNASSSQITTGFLLGTGTYEGLRFRYTQHGSDAADTFTLSGTLEAASTPPHGGDLAITSSSGCDVSDPGATAQVGGVTQTRNLKMTCTGPASDPRLAGSTTVTVNSDAKPDGSAAIWGTAVLENSQGSWTGNWSGTVGPGYTTHRTHGTYVGSGAYDGLSYAYTQIGEPETLYVMTGVIAPAP